jgi:ATP:ADP antiporter, AAA family
MLSRFFDIRPGEIYRISVIACLLFFLIAANNLIKIIRDTVFLSHHSVSELPYLYILVAVIAGALIPVYGRYTANLPVSRLILATNAIVIANIIFFWFLLIFFDPGWSHYAFYIWSAIAGAISVAQVWTLTNEIFSAGEGKRLFGLIAAGGTVGGAAAGFATKWVLELSFDVNHLLWAVAAFFLAASGLILWAQRHLKREVHPRDLVLTSSRDRSANTLGTLLRGSRYIKTIALLILVSVIVSTLIDFELKVAAKEAYSSKQTLAVFFSSYYAWLSIATFFCQTVLTRPALSALGFIPSLYITPGVLLAGSVGIMTSPGLLIAAVTKMADISLRNSIHRSSMEIVFMALPDHVRKLVKTFLDVVFERLGDATAGFIILFYGLFSTGPKITYAHFICVGLIIVWMLLIPLLRIGHIQTLRKQRGSAKLFREVGRANSRSKESLEL